MSVDWPEPVERVAKALREAAVEARLEEFLTETPTAEAAAEAVGCELARLTRAQTIDLVEREPETR